MEIVVQGAGVVGSATVKILQKGNPANEIYVHDPPRSKWYDGDRPDAVVVCTPCLSGLLDDIPFLKSTRPAHVVVRSSIRPEAFKPLEEAMPGVKVSHWPEFLTMATAEHDAMFPDKVVFGTNLDETAIPTFLNNLWGQFYRRWRDRELIITDPYSSAAIKLGINTFYSIKCAFNNMMFDIIHSQQGYNAWVKACELDKRIEVSHEQIRHGGYRGFGGKCLPKDTAALRDCTTSSMQRRFLQELLNLNEHWVGKSAEQIVKEEWNG